MHPYQTTTNHNKARYMTIIHGTYCWSRLNSRLNSTTLSPVRPHVTVCSPRVFMILYAVDIVEQCNVIYCPMDPYKQIWINLNHHSVVQMHLKMSPPKCSAFSAFQWQQQAFNVQGANWSTSLKEVLSAKGSHLLKILSFVWWLDWNNLQKDRAWEYFQYKSELPIWEFRL